MGAFAGAAQAISDRMHEQHLMDYAANRQAAQQIADQYEKIANDPYTPPYYKARFQQEAINSRLTPPGKAPKPSKLSDILEEMEQHKIRENQQALMQGQTPPYKLGQASAASAQEGQQPSNGGDGGGAMPPTPQGPQQQQQPNFDLSQAISGMGMGLPPMPQGPSPGQQLAQTSQVQHDPTTPGIAGQGFAQANGYIPSVEDLVGTIPPFPMMPPGIAPGTYSYDPHQMAAYSQALTKYLDMIEKSYGTAVASRIALQLTHDPVQSANLAFGHPAPYAPTVTPKEGEPVIVAGGPQAGNILGYGANRVVTTPEGGVSTLLPNPAMPGQGLPPTPGSTGPQVIAAPPPKLSEPQEQMQEAVRIMSRKYGFPFDPAKNPRNPSAQVPAQYLEELEATLARGKMAPEMLASILGLRAAHENFTNLLAGLLKANKGPDAVAGWIDALKKNPDLEKDVPTDIRSQVQRGFTQETGLPFPSRLGETEKNQIAANTVALTHINQIKQFLSDPDPAIQSRIGPAMGRLGNVEQMVGATAGLTPEQAMKVQQFRTSLEYLFLREGAALMRGQIRAGLMKQFGEVAPNVHEALPLLVGSLSASEKAAKNTIDAIERQRFNGQAPPPGASVLDKFGGRTEAMTGAVMPLPPAPAGRMYVRKKGTGEIGTISKGNFDPAKYEEVKQ